MNEKYTEWSDLINIIYESSGILFEAGRCHPEHNGLSISGNLPFSISEYEFNYIKNFIIKNDLKNGYELATGIGISTIAIGYALSKNNGKLITVDSYMEEEIQNQPIDNTGLSFSNTGFWRNSMLFKSMGLENVIPYKRSSPECEDILDTEFNNDIDFAFLDCPKDANDFVRDATILKNRINRDKFAIFVHDTHCFEREFLLLSKEIFGIEGIFIFDFKDSLDNQIKQKFQLGLITNIKI
jgi:hypothetical protein